MVISVLGLPAAGKSRLIGTLVERTGATVLHVGKFADEHGLNDPAVRKRGHLLNTPGLTEAFLKRAAEALQRGPVIFDGFPRNEEQARALASQGWRVQVIEMRFPLGQEIELSFSRQIERARAAGEELDTERFLNKIDRALQCDLKAVSVLSELGHQATQIDCLLPEAQVDAIACRELGLNQVEASVA